MEFINNYFWIVVVFILMWFKIDCKKYNRFVVDKFEVVMYYIFSYFTVLHFMTNGIFKG